MTLSTRTDPASRQSFRKQKRWMMDSLSRFEKLPVESSWTQGWILKKGTHLQERFDRMYQMVVLNILVQFEFHLVPRKRPQRLFPPMLFRQTQVSRPDPQPKGSGGIPNSSPAFKLNVASGSRGSYRGPGGDGDGVHAERRSGKLVPHSVVAESDSASFVSSVTEEASSFYDKNFSSGRSNGHWNKQALNVLNQYNVKKTLLQARDSNAYHHQHLQQYGSNHNNSRRHQAEPSLSRLEEEHVNMFRSEV
jgi:hypothetical protein